MTSWCRATDLGRRKTLWPLLLAVLLLLAASGGTGGGAAVARAAGNAVVAESGTGDGRLALAAGASPRQVVFIRYPIAVAHFATVVEHFRATMNARGFREGQEVEYVDILVSRSDQGAVPEVLAAVERYRRTADLFVTCGWVSLYARQLLRDDTTPQFFAPVLHGVALEMLPAVTEPPGTNLSGVYLMYNPEKILRLARLLLPGARNYAYVYDSRIPADLVYRKGYEELAAGDRHGFKLHFLDLAQGVEPVREQLAGLQIQVYGGIVGVFEQRKALAAAGIPVITSYTLDVDRESLPDYMGDDNIVAGLFNPFSYAGEQVAEMAADIFAGRAAIGELIPRRAMQVAFINLRNVEKLGLKVSLDALEAVDFVVR